MAERAWACYYVYGVVWKGFASLCKCKCKCVGIGVGKGCDFCTCVYFFFTINSACRKGLLTIEVS